MDAPNIDAIRSLVSIHVDHRDERALLHLQSDRREVLAKLPDGEHFLTGFRDQLVAELNEIDAGLSRLASVAIADPQPKQVTPVATEQSGQINALQQIIDGYVALKDTPALIHLKEHRLELLNRTPDNGFLLKVLRTQLLAELTLIEAGLRRLTETAVVPRPAPPPQIALDPYLISSAILAVAIAGHADNVEFNSLLDSQRRFEKQTRS